MLPAESLGNWWLVEMMNVAIPDNTSRAIGRLLSSAGEFSSLPRYRSNVPRSFASFSVQGTCKALSVRSPECLDVARCVWSKQSVNPRRPPLMISTFNRHLHPDQSAPSGSRCKDLSERVFHHNPNLETDVGNFIYPS